MDQEKMLTFVDIDKENSMAREKKKGIMPLPCAWCEEPEEFEDMEAKIEVKKTDETERLERR